ncbi:hypothetical protein [Vibrio phage BUCT194]|uniref:Uncharacterized protein n=1 Tax=Vibrio phage BUCT194 TaxID=2859072 RepID=A0AAE8XHI7_9CAUD|nr:hypothetical protein PP741_gp054 [Vibrio phage BUCT194]UAW01171.1 hypothetical protein [Vibrio phage BUCT194]
MSNFPKGVRFLNNIVLTIHKTVLSFELNTTSKIMVNILQKYETSPISFIGSLYYSYYKNCENMDRDSSSGHGRQNIHSRMGGFYSYTYK